MATLCKEQYAYRERSARIKNENNIGVAISNGMTEEQAELIAELCALRHELHTNMDKVVTDDFGSIKIKPRLVELNQRIEQSGIEPMQFIPYNRADYIDIDDLFELNVSEEDYADEYNRIYGELSELHNKIEDYLRDLDKEYGTDWCPTGALRIM